MRRTTHAFSLTELLIAVVISAILTGGLWGVLVSQNKTAEESSAIIAATRSAMLAIEWVRRDLARLAVPRPKAPVTANPDPIRFTSPSHATIWVMPPADALSLAQDAAVLPIEAIRYRFIPPGQPGWGLYRNDERLNGITLDRFELAVVEDPASGEPFVRISVTGADPAGHRTLFFRELVHLAGLGSLQRHRHTVPNPFPKLQPLPPPGVV